jgi:hypothetical protein
MRKMIIKNLIVNIYNKNIRSTSRYCVEEKKFPFLFVMDIYLLLVSMLRNVSYRYRKQ